MPITKSKIVFELDLSDRLSQIPISKRAEAKVRLQDYQRSRPQLQQETKRAIKDYGELVECKNSLVSKESGV